MSEPKDPVRERMLVDQEQAAQDKFVEMRERAQVEFDAMSPEEQERIWPSTDARDLAKGLWKPNPLHASYTQGRGPGVAEYQRLMSRAVDPKRDYLEVGDADTGGIMEELNPGISWVVKKHLGENGWNVVMGGMEAGSAERSFPDPSTGDSKPHGDPTPQGTVVQGSQDPMTSKTQQELADLIGMYAYPAASPDPTSTHIDDGGIGEAVPKAQLIAALRAWRQR